jgi:hypothetical protein
MTVFFSKTPLKGGGGIDVFFLAVVIGAMNRDEWR